MTKIHENRVVLITGSGRGLGAATAMEFARQGARVVINDIDAPAAESIAQEAGALGADTLVSTHDVSDKNQAEELAKAIHGKFGQMDILVNNAGILRDAMLLKTSEKDWDDVIRVNLKGPFNMAQAVVPFMKEKKFGRILNLSSVAAKGNIGQTNYSAAKAGVIGMTRTWALELSRYNITVNAIQPGLIETEMTAKIPDEIKERLIQSVPLKRMGLPSEIAGLISFLTSDHAAYITGQSLCIDGGLTTGLKLS